MYNNQMSTNSKASFIMLLEYSSECKRYGDKALKYGVIIRKEQKLSLKINFLKTCFFGNDTFKIPLCRKSNRIFQVILKTSA